MTRKTPTIKSVEILARLEVALGPELSTLFRLPVFGPDCCPVKRGTLQRVLIEYESYTSTFPCILARVISEIREDNLRFPLVRQLWEEHGAGDLHQSHRQLLASLRVSLSGALPPSKYQLPEPTLNSTTVAMDLLSRPLDICQPGLALGLLLGLEVTNRSQLHRLTTGILSGLPRDADVRYLAVHEAVDDDHVTEIVEIAENLLRSGNISSEAILTGAKNAVAGDITFWDGVSDFLFPERGVQG
jgi:pyrroloquinoline quinone (PQQ) biosynthesis protein C